MIRIIFSVMTALNVKAYEKESSRQIQKQRQLNSDQKSHNISYRENSEDYSWDYRASSDSLISHGQIESADSNLLEALGTWTEAK
ncbi:MAG: hypothetical protein KF802_01800 [Bdellovibrionaceae bacterium]|nr:hypothetical protein [Pseudobdellovibrionaceae bacterium]